MTAPVTLKGRMVRDPELKFDGQGKAVAVFSVVTSDRYKDKETGEWQESGTSFHNCVAFGQIAENICETCVQGTAVVATGKLQQEKYTKDGENRTAWKVKVDDLGPSLRWVTAEVRANEERGGVVKRQAVMDDAVPF